MHSSDLPRAASEPTSQIEMRLAMLRDGLHRAYCLSVCLDRALRHNDSDDSPELAVCVREYLVRPLDALSIEAEQIRQTLFVTIESAEKEEQPR